MYYLSILGQQCRFYLTVYLTSGNLFYVENRNTLTNIIKLECSNQNNQIGTSRISSNNAYLCFFYIQEALHRLVLLRYLSVHLTTLLQLFFTFNMTINQFI